MHYLARGNPAASQRRKGTSYYCGVGRKATRDGDVVVFGVVVQKLIHHHGYFPRKLPQHLHSYQVEALMEYCRGILCNKLDFMLATRQYIFIL